MKQIDNGRKNTSKIYYLNDKNTSRISKLENVAYSKDRKYALVYTQEDYDFMDRFWELYKKGEYYNKSSTEDMLYDLLLDETKIEPYEHANLKLMSYEIDFSNEELVKIDGFIIPACVINKELSFEQGSDIIIVIGTTDTHAIVASIEENSNDL